MPAAQVVTQAPEVRTAGEVHEVQAVVPAAEQVVHEESHCRHEPAEG